MKNSFVITFALIVLSLCSCRKNKTDLISIPNSQSEIQDSVETMLDSLNKDMDSIESPKVIDNSNASERNITKEMAFEGINNYCHSAYDWSIAEENPSMMYLKMGEETESEYQVIFRSYTGAFVYFYVEKTNGSTRMVEYVPTLDVENEVGTIDLFDYI